MDFTQATLEAAAAVTVVTELFKLKLVPSRLANKYPVPTNIILSIVAAIYVTPIHWAWSNSAGDASQVAMIAVTAALAYNQLLAKWSQLKALEG